MSANAVIQRHDDKIAHAARAGYAARGLVYVIIGYFAFRAAYSSGRTMSSEEAVREVFGSPFGTLLLSLLAAAFLSFGLWRLVQAAFDVDRHGTGLKGLGVRAGFTASGMSYILLTVFSVFLLVGISQEGGGGSQLTQLLSPLFGPWFTIAMGLLMLVVAGAHVVKAVTASFERYMPLPRDHALWMRNFCRFGLLARGFTFVVIAFLLFTGATLHSFDETPGLEDALDQLAAWPYGGMLLSVTGVGLVAFGGYSLLQARYRRIRMPEV